MDTITNDLREMYEQFPYPSGPVTLLSGSDARLLLSYVEKSRSSSRPIQVLDAGCGRGSGLIGSAMVQPDVQFTGADMNRVALNELSAEVQKRKLGNIKVKECDLMTLEGLEVPDGGFDVIVSSGVLHHLSSPVQGLRKLREVLARHGVITIMVYDKEGRAPLQRLVNALKVITSPHEPLHERLPYARAMTRQGRYTILSGNPWIDTLDADDVEVVDRCFNVNETAYNVYEFWDLLDKAGMRFIRWAENEEWAANCLQEPLLREKARNLSELDRFRLIELICWRPRIDMVISRDDNEPRAPIEKAQIENELFAVSSEVSFDVSQRNLHDRHRIEKVSFKLRGRERHDITSSLLSKAIMILMAQDKPFNGNWWISILGREGINREIAVDLLVQLTQLEILFRPHPIDR